jgi:transcriptional regulator with XRE-family HTH domain
MADRSFGRIIEDRRRELGLTQEMVAKKVGVKANYIGYLERGMRHPSQKVVERLSNALKLDSQELYLLANPRVRALLGKAPAKAASSGQSLWQKFLRDSSMQQSQGLNSREKEALVQLAAVERAASPASIARAIKALRRGFAGS